MRWRGFHTSSLYLFMSPCQILGLREKPAAAVARAAAPYFFGLRERRRRAEGQAPRSRPRRSRPGRLRDRLRAVSHRVRLASRLRTLEMPEAPNAVRERQSSEAVMGSGQSSPGSKNSSSQQLDQAARWVKKKVKPLCTSVSSRVQLVCQYVSRVFSAGYTAAKYVDKLFSLHGLCVQTFTGRLCCGPARWTICSLRIKSIYFARRVPRL